MLKKVSMVMLLCLAGMKVKSQYLRYDPIPYVPPSQAATYTVPPPSDSNPPTINAQRVAGYIIDASTANVTKLNLQIVIVNRSVIVTAVKPLTSETWTTYSMNRPVAQKLYSNEAYSNNFEYKVYIPVLGKTVYF